MVYIKHVKKLIALYLRELGLKMDVCFNIKTLKLWSAKT